MIFVDPIEDRKYAYKFANQRTLRGAANGGRGDRLRLGTGVFFYLF